MGRWESSSGNAGHSYSRFQDAGRKMMVANTQNIRIMVINFKIILLYWDPFWQEAKYRSLDEEEEKKKKLQLSKMSKYKKVVY